MIKKYTSLLQLLFQVVDLGDFSGDFADIYYNLISIDVAVYQLTQKQSLDLL